MLFRLGLEIPSQFGQASHKQVAFGKLWSCVGSIENHPENYQVPKLDEYLTIREAADFLGVAPNTLRNWGSCGKIVEHRHPINNYRLYRKQDLEEILQATEKSSQPKRKPK